jgi:hypothetical protein
MQTITTIGFDIAKSVFQVHGVDRWPGRHPQVRKLPQHWKRFARASHKDQSLKFAFVVPSFAR